MARKAVRKVQRAGKKASRKGRKVANEWGELIEEGKQHVEKVVKDVENRGFSALHDHALHAYSSYPHMISHLRRATPHTMSLIRHGAALLSGEQSQEVLHHHLGHKDLHRGGRLKLRYKRVPVAAYRDLMRSTAHSLGGALSQELLDRSRGYDGNGLAAATENAVQAASKLAHGMYHRGHEAYTKVKNLVKEGGDAVTPHLNKV